MGKWFVRALLFSFIVVVAAIGTVLVWGLDQRLPPGLTVSGWKVGGLTLAQFDAKYKERVSGLYGTKVLMRGELPGSAAAKAERGTSLGELGLQMNASEVREQVASVLKGNVWERAVRRWEWRNREIVLRYRFSEKKFNERVRTVWPEMYASEPVNAVRVITKQDTVKYVPGRSVVRIETVKLRGAVLSAMGEPRMLLSDASGDALAVRLAVDVPLYELQPEVTVESLKAEGIERLIAKYSTSFVTSSAGRKHNVKSTASVVNDIVLPPGGVFDYAKMIAKTSRLYGFREAPVIFNGKLVPGIGGGICQVSTTIYSAVLRAGLEIVERRNHSLPISYAPMGQDATFSNGYINFKWRNSTGKHLLVRTETTGDVLTVKLFGSMPKNVTYEIRSVKVKTIEAPVKYVKNSSLPKGSVSLLQKGKPGYVVDTFRYKKVGGKVVATERISRDTYKPQPFLYASNAGGSSTTPPAPRRDSEPHIVEDGVFGPLFDTPEPVDALAVE